MQSQTLTPFKLFASPTRYVVPLFQRPYVWNEKDQWEPLWEDVRTVAERLVEAADAGPFDLPEVSPHFLGAIVVEQRPVAAGLDEAERMTRWYGLRPGIMQPIRRDADGAWGLYRVGMALDVVATVASVMLVLRESGGLAAAMKQAVALGGDTDTTAAIVGGILGSQAGQAGDVEGEIPWLSSVILPEPETVEAMAAQFMWAQAIIPSLAPAQAHHNQLQPSGNTGSGEPEGQGLAASALAAA
jgi:hypothetical protein